MDSESVFVIGRGAIGSLVSASIAQNQVCPPVVWVARRSSSPDTDVEVTLCGSVTLSVSSSVRFQGCSELPSELTNSVVVICTKAFDLTACLYSITQCSAPRVLVILCNGIGLYETAREILPTWPIVRGVLEVGVKKADQNLSYLYEVVGVRKVRLASNDSEALAIVSRLFTSASFEVKCDPSVVALEWRKGILNTVVNSVATLLNRENAAVLDEPTVALLTRPAFEEAVCVAKACGAYVEDLSWDSFCTFVRGVGSNINSTLVDTRAMRPTELSYFLGEVLKSAESLGIATPTLQRMAVTLLP